MSPPPPDPATDAPTRLGPFTRTLAFLLAAGGLALYAHSAATTATQPATAPATRPWPPYVAPLVIAAAAVGLTALFWLLRVPQRLSATLDALRNPAPRTRRVLALLLGIAASLYCYATAVRQGHDFNLRVHDENMYMVQAQQLAHGRLWMPQHPCPDFFESFHIFARPVYASMYFPGTALLYALPVRLNLPTWPLSLTVAGLGVALAYLVLTRLTDGLLAILGAVMLLGLNRYRYYSTMMMSHPLMMALGLLMILAALNWQQTRRRRWLVVIGVAAGWAILARPLDGLCYVGPVGLFLLWESRRDAWRKRLAAVAIPIAAGTPLLALQLIMNVGITGKVTRTPVSLYLDTYWPDMQIQLAERGKRARPIDSPARKLPQFQAFYSEFVFPAVKRHRALPLSTTLIRRTNKSVNDSLPGEPLWILVPVGLLALARQRRWLLFLPVSLFVGGYLLFPFFLMHYSIVIAPGWLMLAVLGIDTLRRAAGRAGPFVATALVVFAVLTTVRATPEYSGKADETDTMPTLRDVNAQLAALPKGERALVFFTYHPGDNWGAEPVYTLDAPTPDDARIVRAHDLGDARNAELIAHYARTQPDRRVYRYDLRTRQLTEVGPVTKLVH